MHFLGCGLRRGIVQLGVTKLVAGSDANASDVDVAGRLHALVAVAALEVVVAAGKCDTVAEDRTHDCQGHHYCCTQRASPCAKLVALAEFQHSNGFANII